MTEKQSAPRGRRALHVACILLVALIVAGGVGALGIALRWWRGPYPRTMRDLSWKLGFVEPAYNFGEVVPGRIYRSCRPDERLYRYLHNRYGVRHVVRLFEVNDEIPMPPRDLGWDATVLQWHNHVLPPRDELRQVLAAFDSNSPVLIHCYSGADRTGYAVGAYRVLRQGWSVERAVEEMERFEYRRSVKPWYARHLAELARERNAAPVAPEQRPR